MADAAFTFEYDERLGLRLPVLHKPYDAMTEDERARLLLILENVSGRIPERIRDLERRYLELYRQAQSEEGEAFFRIMEEASALSAAIAELNVLYWNIQGHFLTTYVG
ncbi:MAG: hypothetical protein IMW86_07625 [Hydrogenibacillus sp.]|nr:hypothetical protein [Hydrogenibacillus sp.]